MAQIAAQPVVLNSTLADLYHHDGQDNVILCPQALITFRDSSNQMPSKYRYHDYNIARPKSQIPKDPEKKEEELSESIMYFALKGHRNAFIAGDMKVMLFDTTTATNSNDGRRDTELTVNALSTEQRPQLVCLSSFDQLSSVLDKTKFEKLAVLLPIDGLENQPQVINPEVLWELLSKRGLAVSGVPTPKAVLVELDSQRENSEDDYVRRGLGLLRHRPLPYVVKVNQTIGGYGTFVITTEEERSEVLEDFESAVLPNLLEMVKPENRHMRPETLVVTDYVPSNESMGIAFFVRKSGEAIFISGSVQKFTNQHHYDGSMIDFSAQESFAAEYTGIMNEVADFLHRKGYYGPAGVDLLKDEKTGKSYVVDLNVRIPGSIVVGLLSDHFTKRGLNWACMEEDLKLPFKREEFLERMENDISEGRLIIVCWHEEWEAGGAIGSFLLGAETEEKLQKFLADLKALGK
ncbi:unnamed protein product [Calypogeia fissa]